VKRYHQVQTAHVPAAWHGSHIPTDHTINPATTDISPYWPVFLAFPVGNCDMYSVLS